MNKLEETFIILKHFDGRIKGRIGYCKRNKDFNVSEYVKSKLNEIYSGEIENNKQENLLNGGIARECVDKQLIIHSFLCLNIIDIFSFDDEYELFNETMVENESLARRIRAVKVKNKTIRKKLIGKN